MSKQKSKDERVAPTNPRKARAGAIPESDIAKRIHHRAAELNISREVMANAVHWKPVSFRRRLREGEPPAMWIGPLSTLLRCRSDYLLTGVHPPVDEELPEEPRINP